MFRNQTIYCSIYARNDSCIELSGEINQESNLIIREEAQFRKRDATVSQNQLMLVIQDNGI